MKFIKHLLGKPKQAEADKDYFVQARSWADDIYTEVIASRNRYRFALFWSVGLITCLLILLMMLIPLEHTELIVVHHSEAGTVWVEPLHQSYAPKNKAQIESEIVRYVNNRESYSAISYDEQYSLVNLMSDRSVSKQYIVSQSIGNKNSDINRLGNRGTRVVHVENVIFLDKRSLNKSKYKRGMHHNLAQINFVVRTHDRLTGKTSKQPLVALISWTYHGTPKNPETKWRNWDGCTVTHYSIEQRNV